MKYKMCMIITLLFSTHIMLPANTTSRRQNLCAKVLKTGCCFLALVGGHICASVGFTTWMKPTRDSITPPMPIPCEVVFVDEVQLFSKNCNNTGCPKGFDEVAICAPPDHPNSEGRFSIIEKDLQGICPGSQEIYAWQVRVPHCTNDITPVPPCNPLEFVMERLNKRCNPEKYHAKLQALKKTRTRR